MPISTSHPEPALPHGLRPEADCGPCLLRQAREAAACATADPRLREAAVRAAQAVLESGNERLPPPALAQRLHRAIRRVTGNGDPYAEVKQRLNQWAVELERVWQPRFAARFPAFEAAVRLAIAGNLLDVGAKTQLGETAVTRALEAALTEPLAGSVTALAEAVRRSRRILFLADNAGEIVFDRWLLAQLPLGGFTVAVRGGPVLNDATLADARWAGLPDFCEVISNGSDAPGTLLEDCSGAFREQFEAADLVLAKGQGNFETLLGCPKSIFFLFKVKCEVAARTVGLPLGSLVLHRPEPGVRAAGTPREGDTP